MVLTVSTLQLIVMGAPTAGAATPPVFPQQYSARVHEVAHTVSGEKEILCDFYFDAVNNLTSWRNCGWKGTQMQTVARFTDDNYGPRAKIFYIYGHGPAGDTCSHWCDGQGDIQCNIQESLCQIDYKKSAKWHNSSTYNGTECDVFTWTDKLGPIPMNSLTLFVAKDTATPLLMERDVHPFGRKMGLITTKYLSFTEGAPPESAFDVPGESKCTEGEAGQCPTGAELRDHFRLFKAMQQAAGASGVA